MKRFISLFILSLFLLSSCGTSQVKQASENTEFRSTELQGASVEEMLLGKWEMTFNDNTTICVFETNGKGHFIIDSGKEVSFTYRIINDHQLEQTMVTLDGVENTSVYEFEFKDNRLILDGLEYFKKQEIA